MKLKILSIFIDKYTGETYDVDSIIDFEEKRAKELLSDKRNLVELVKEEVEEVKEEVKPKKKTSKK